MRCLWYNCSTFCNSFRVANTLVYYGLTLGVGSLGVNIYIASALSFVVEIPGSILIVPPIEYWGRRLPYIALMLISGIACLITAFIRKSLWTCICQHYTLTLLYEYHSARHPPPPPLQISQLRFSSILSHFGKMCCSRTSPSCQADFTFLQFRRPSFLKCISIQAVAS